MKWKIKNVWNHQPVPIDSLSSGFPIGTSRRHVFGDHELPGLVDMQKATWKMAQSKYWIFPLKVVIFQLCKRLPEGIQMRDSYGISIWFLWYFYDISMGFLVLVVFLGTLFPDEDGLWWVFIHPHWGSSSGGWDSAPRFFGIFHWMRVGCDEGLMGYLIVQTIKCPNGYWLVVEPPLWKMMEFVTWGYYSQYMEKINPNVPNHQPDILLFQLLTIINHRLTID